MILFIVLTLDILNKLLGIVRIHEILRAAFI